MAKDEEKVSCPVCGYEVGTKEDGTKFKVHKVAGERCDGSEAEVQSDVSPAGIDKGQSYEALESPQDDAQATDDSTDPADETGAQTDAQGSEDESADAEVFTYVVRVRKPAPHLDQADKGWHEANVEMASKLAEREGIALTREPRHAGNEDAGTHTIVRYSAPVK